VLDVRLSRPFTFGRFGRIELLLDRLNLLNNTAEESLASEVLGAATFGQPNSFIDPRRAMLSVGLNLGR
jgi:hypothetical protein